MIVEELSGRLEQLKYECPTDWSPIKQDIDKGHVDMRSKYEETMEEIGKVFAGFDPRIKRLDF